MKKLLLGLFMVLTLPVLASMVGSRHQAQAFNSVAVAGRSVVGGAWCACGCSDCICDPDEVPIACGERATVAPPSDSSGLMLLLFALALAARFAMRR